MATVNELEQALVNADKAGDEAAAKVLAQALQDARAGQQVSPQPTDRQQFMTSWYGRLMRGLQDPVDAGAQMLVRGAAKVFPSLESEVSRVDEMVKGDAQEYEQARAAAGQSGFDLNRTLGSTALQLLALRGLPVPAAGASLGARTALGAASGAGYGAMQPVTEGDFWTETVRQTGLGAATGAAARAAPMPSPAGDGVAAACEIARAGTGGAEPVMSEAAGFGPAAIAACVCWAACAAF